MNQWIRTNKKGIGKENRWLESEIKWERCSDKKLLANNIGL